MTKMHDDGTGDYCVTMVRVHPRIYRAGSLDDAIARAVAAEERGALDVSKYAWTYQHPHLVFPVPTAEENKGICAALEALQAAIVAMRDPALVRAQRLAAARALTRAAMCLMREEAANSNHPEVIKAAESAFGAAKVVARAACKGAA